MPAITLDELSRILQAMGCPEDKCPEMAAQLDRRARQLAESKDRTYDQALEHLLRLMAQGWSAQERGIDPPTLS